MSGSVSTPSLVLGAVAYDPKVVTIWDGFRAWLRGPGGLDFDYVLYSNYERQVEDLVAGRVDVAWNSPLAWVRARRLAAARGVTLTPVTMRDTDRDLRSVVAVRADSPVQSLADLRGRTVGTGRQSAEGHGLRSHLQCRSLQGLDREWRGRRKADRARDVAPTIGV